ncbi:MAG TPA: lipopolysaccharide biosynthesis protein, partial [Candidatus Omnitrophota bacterium]|nr:lipopolysaccharide biosynthesis protein [Candidatus Omnitrophota bacterium]
QSQIVNSTAVLGLTTRALELWRKPVDYEKHFASRFKKPFIVRRARKVQKLLEKLDDGEKKQYLYRRALEDLKTNITVSPIKDTNIFMITVKDFSPIGAAILANAISRSFVIFDLEQQLAELGLKYGEKYPTVLQLKDSIIEMAKNLDGRPLDDVEAIGPASVKIIEQASVPMSPMGTPKLPTAMLGFILSIFTGILLAFLFEYFDSTFRSPKDIEQTLKVSYLGSVPKDLQLNYNHNFEDHIFVLMKNKKLKSLMLASSLSKEMVGPILVKLGNWFSKSAGLKVLMIDGNLRNPSTYDYFKGVDSFGLSDVLEGRMKLQGAVKEISLNLSVLRAGKVIPHPHKLLNSDEMRDLLDQAKMDYDVVLVNSAALNEYKDGVILARHMDGVAIVINEGFTRKHVVADVKEALNKNKANIIGAILNNRTFPIPETIYKRF